VTLLYRVRVTPMVVEGIQVAACRATVICEHLSVVVFYLSCVTMV
jgi:hypothetical protein